jgi:hypothetical protein
MVMRYNLAMAMIGFLGLAVAASGAADQPAPATDVPVKRVVLYSSGVGYFEHAGKVVNDGRAELRFRTEQINDMLKSLVLQDLGGGTVGAVVYPSQNPLAKTLKSFQVDISANPSLGELLNQLRGAEVVVEGAGEEITGVILGLEKVEKPVAEGQPVRVWMLNLISGGLIRAVELGGLRRIELVDEQLQAELNGALTALTQARDQDKKPVHIEFRGQGERPVRMGYVIETPIWKTTYRLVMPEDDSDTGYLQGWAIVENQTESDWSDVTLSLVSGRPISFVQDLYQPLYVKRPVVQPELYASLMPQQYDDGLAGGMGGGRRAARRRGRPSSPAAAPSMELAETAAPAKPLTLQYDVSGGRVRCLCRSRCRRLGGITGQRRRVGRVVPIPGAGRVPAAAAFGNDSDRDRRSRGRAIEYLQPARPGQAPAERRAAEEHHRQVPDAGADHGHRRSGLLR